MMSFKIDYTDFSEDLPTLIIELIGYFSKDGNSQYHADLSQLKYYIPPPNSDVCFNLDKNSASTHYKSDINYKLDDILKWISDNFNRLEKPLSVCAHRWYVIN